MKLFYLFMLKLLDLMRACEYSNIYIEGLAEVKKISLIGSCESLIEMRGKASAWDLDFRETGPLPVFWCWLSNGILDGIRPYQVVTIWCLVASVSADQSFHGRFSEW